MSLDEPTHGSDNGVNRYNPIQQPFSNNDTSSSTIASSTVTVPDRSNVLLYVDQVSKWFGNVHALTDITIWAYSGEITAIVGDNGAGKSTLIKCISGVHTPTAGQITLDGKPVHFASPEDARRTGIETVYQTLALCNDLTIWQNLFLNRELVKQIGPLKFLDQRTMRRRSADMLSRLEVNIPSINARVRRLSGGQRQAVAISRAAGWGSRLVIMDEPTAALGVRETARVEELILRLRDDGLAVLLISHNFDQVMRLSDQVWVMRSGRLVGGRRTHDTSGKELVSMITGAQQEA
ncbi:MULTISPECIES: ATP-binding cassette domain-containing protein [unclassified Leptolyngbya]|uniref:ATP-binding cassette domain-containing protein n=1 Tax=unclassified Leptolyngbya TaxID=2650499 RepID=UPI001683D374|nr:MULTISPECIES: ATP-binding cassette domain-containing protein [unclassified Leptolyngbya]MBD1909139.1 sugar ABC transporter ATP-binding protein [Leptolyngbya sp. FACHB-8]MBD2157513.1 sugar ABC transporter ATP-binding protein [Leptolyngbya sp. FACHB-16]